MKKSGNLLIAAAISFAAAGLLSAGAFEKDIKSVENLLSARKAGPASEYPVPEPVPASASAVTSTGGYASGLPDRMNTHKDAELLSLSEADLASATADQKVEMLQTLIRHSDPSMREGGQSPEQKDRELTIGRILASAPDAAAFDRLYYRLDIDKLYGSVSDRRPILLLAAKARASAVPGDWDALGRYIGTVTEARPPSRNLVKFLIDGASAIAEGGKALRAAKSSIHIEMFQFQSDNVGWGLAKLLSEKVKDGVSVRVLIDKYGSDLDNDPELARLIAFLRDSGAMVITKELPFMKSHLDHRKVVVVDGSAGFTGGMNIGRLYQIDWHDQQAFITGPAVTEMQRAFAERWYLAGGGLLSGAELYPYIEEVPAGAATQVVTHVGLRDQNIKAVYLRAVGTAQKSVRIANPYLTDEDIIDVLCGAARRGVRVQLVLPRETDQPIVQHASRSAYPKLLKAGAEIYEYKGRMAHEKVAVMDGRWSTFGSSNLDARSLINNDELNLIVDDAGLAEDIGKRLFDADLLNSERILTYSPDIVDHTAGHFRDYLYNKPVRRKL